MDELGMFIHSYIQRRTESHLEIAVAMMCVDLVPCPPTDILPYNAGAGSRNSHFRASHASWIPVWSAKERHSEESKSQRSVEDFFPASSRGGRGSADSQTQQPCGGSLSPVSSGSTTSSSKVSKSVSRMLVPGPSQVSSFMLLLRAGQ